MQKTAERLSQQEIAERRERRLEAMHLQEIEGNPLDAEDIAMFEMFDREGWDDERCLAYIRGQALKSSK
jgi:Fic family protein